MANLFRNPELLSPDRARTRSQLRLPADALQAHRLGLHQRVLNRQLAQSERIGLIDLIGQTVLSRSRVMKSTNFSVASVADLQSMAELYDIHFFGGHCLPIAKHFGLKFRWSSRMTSNGGKTVRIVQKQHRTERVSYEIVLSAPLLFQTFSDLMRPIRVTGVLCTNRLQAMQRIMEHELIHLVEMLVWEQSCCAAPRFQGIVSRLFGHTEHKHDLVTQQERADQRFNVRVGTRVVFQYEGRLLRGTVNRITRRATVLVADPQGQLYDDGNRYRKYYVPLSHLYHAKL